MSWWKENTFWTDWTAECHKFDKTIENLLLREDLTDIEKENIQMKWLECFNQKMNIRLKEK